MPNIVKKWMRREYSDRFEGMDVCILVDYQELNANEITRFRAELANNNIEMMVLKNSIAEYAFEDAEIENLTQFLAGPTAIVFGPDEPVQLAKSVVGLRKENESLEILGGVIDHSPIHTEKIEQLSELPTRDELLGQLARGMLSPVQNLATALNSPLQSLARGLKELSEGSEDEE